MAIEEAQAAPATPSVVDTLSEFRKAGLKEHSAYQEKYVDNWTHKPKTFPYAESASYKAYSLGLVGECNACEFKNRISRGTEISKDDFRELIELLENPDSYSNSTAACFDPKIAIVGYDEEGVPTEYMSICLNCNNFRSSPGKVAIEYKDDFSKGFSGETRNTLRALFFKWGIDYYGFSPAWDEEAPFLEYLEEKGIGN